MQFSAIELANLLNGKVEGDASVKVHTLSKVEDAQAGSLSFVSNPKYIPFIYSTQASILIVNEDLEIAESDPIQPTLIRVKNAYESFAILLEKYQSLQHPSAVIEPQSFVDATASIGKNNYVGAFAYIGKNVQLGDNVKIYPQTYIGNDVSIGNNSIIYAGVKIYHNCEIGQNCILHSGVVIGSDGFGFAPQADGQFKKIPQIGKVVIEDNVEIGANTTIDRATLGETIIRKGVKLDNLIQIAHNVEIGENTVIAAQTGVSGSTKVGQNCMIGGQVGFVGHVSIAAGSKINAQSGVARPIKEPNKAWMGAPAMEYRQFMRSQVVFRQLPELQKKIKQLEKKITHT